MNKLSAIRSFGKSGYCPAKGKLKIYNAGWYLCTFQNVERDQGDGMYLGEGEYTQLLPGLDARRARDSQLNHLNDFTEYDGEVYEVTYPWWQGLTEYGAGLDDAQKIAAEREAKNAADYAQGCKHFEAKLARTDAEIEAKEHVFTEWGHQLNAAGWRRDYQATYTKYQATYAATNKAVIRKVERPETFVKSVDVGPDITYKVMCATPWCMENQKFNIYRNGDLVLQGADAQAMRHVLPPAGSGAQAVKSTKATTTTPPAASNGPATVTRERDWTWVHFASKPDEPVRDSLKGLGARFSSRRAAWYITQPVTDDQLANVLAAA